MKVECFYCGRELDPTSRYVWHRITGWERKAVAASRKSGSDVALREQADGLACDPCISRMQNGVAPQQGALI